MASEEKQAEEIGLTRRAMRALTRGIGETTPRSVIPPIPGDRLPIAQRYAGENAAPPAETDTHGFTQQVTVTSESKLLLPADPKRKFLYIGNNDALGYVMVSFGVAATLNVGMRLAANGGGILLDNHVPTAAIFVIGSIASNSNVSLISW